MMGPIATMDAPVPAIPLPSGIYRLSLITDTGIADKDFWIVEITTHACVCVPPVEIAKR